MECACLSPLFFWLLPASLLIGGCRNEDDIVATLQVDAASDVSLPPPVDDGGIRIDTSFDDVPLPPPIDMNVPMPDVVPDIVIPPPPVDAPTTCEPLGLTVAVSRVNGTKVEEVCAGQLAAHTFTHALCACGDLSLSFGFNTGSFDSSAADKTPVFAGAPVGVRGNYPPVGSQIGGSLTVTGTPSNTPTISGPLNVAGDLRLAGGMTFGGFLIVQRDAWLATASRVGYIAIASIARNLYVPRGGGPYGLTTLNLGGMRYEGPFTVGDPCGCDDRLDVATMEKAGAARAENVDHASLNNVTTPTMRQLPCGRLRFESIGGTALIQLTVTGRTAIFVDGDVTASDSFQLLLAPGPNVEVDWFIGGNLSVGAAKIGDPARPSATRIYVAGTQDIQLPNSSSIAANLYAPNANVSIMAGVAGSVYGKAMSVPMGTSIRYDRSILNQGNRCEQPLTCEKCRYCNGGAACMNGVCNTCVSDDDCCAPLVCEAGVCQSLLKLPP